MSKRSHKSELIMPYQAFLSQGVMAHAVIVCKWVSSSSLGCPCFLFHLPTCMIGASLQYSYGNNLQLLVWKCSRFITQGCCDLVWAACRCVSVMLICYVFFVEIKGWSCPALVWEVVRQHWYFICLNCYEQSPAVFSVFCRESFIMICFIWPTWHPKF